MKPLGAGCVNTVVACWVQSLHKSRAANPNPGSPWGCCTLCVHMLCPWQGEGEVVHRGPAHHTFPNPGSTNSPARFPGGDDWHVLGWWHRCTKILHTLSEQAQGSQNGPPFPRSILNLVLLMLEQLSRRGGKKERRRRLIMTSLFPKRDSNYVAKLPFLFL